MSDLFGHEAAPAGRAMGSHQSSKPGTVTWLTPPWITKALGGAESFALDPCAFPGWETARVGLSLPTDGLAASWGRHGHDPAFVNPPYTTGEVDRWMHKLADHGAGVALIFARTETEMFHREVWGRASGLLFLEGRLHFHYPDADPKAPCIWTGQHRWVTKSPATRAQACAACGVAQANAGAPSVLCAYGQHDLDRLAASDIPGALTPLRFPRFIVVQAVLQENWRTETWREAVLAKVREHRGPVSVSDLYRELAPHPKARRSRSWQAKVRQTLQRGPFTPLGQGLWEAAA